MLDVHASGPQASHAAAHAGGTLSILVEGKEGAAIAHEGCIISNRSEPVCGLHACSSMHLMPG